MHYIVANNPDQTPGGTYELRSALAAAILNARQMGGQPIALALGLAAAAVPSLALTVLSSVRRRRHELALLKALGMTRGQLRSVVAWQTTLTLLIAVAIGGPLGVAGAGWPGRASRVRSGPCRSARSRWPASSSGCWRSSWAATCSRPRPRPSPPGPAPRSPSAPNRPTPASTRRSSARDSVGRVLVSPDQVCGPRGRTGPVDSRTTRALGSTVLTGARPVRMYLPSRVAASVPSRVANRFTVLSAGSVSSE